MLNKEICKKCHKQYCEELAEKIHREPVCFSRWNQYDEQSWNKGEVECYYDMGILVSIDKIPKNCRYKLEQILKQT